MKTSRLLIVASALFLMVACASKPVNMRVSHMGSTWDIGEVKSCLQFTLKGEQSPVLLCSPEAGAAYFMTAGAMEGVADEKTRSKLRELFYEKTKIFAVTFEQPTTGADGKPIEIWNCRKTETNLQCKHVGSQSAAATSNSTVSTSPSSAPPATTPAANNWSTRESVNSIDGVKTTVLTNGQGNQNILIRFKGPRLDAYVITPEMVGHDDVSVRIRFDEGKPIRQTWERSKDYHALFSPDPRGLLAKLQNSKKFYFEYHPYQKLPETLIFNVDGLVAPKALLDTHDKLRQKEQVVWKKKFDACMEEQRQSALAPYQTEADRRSFCRITAR